MQRAKLSLYRILLVFRIDVVHQRQHHLLRKNRNYFLRKKQCYIKDKQIEKRGPSGDSSALHTPPSNITFSQPLSRIFKCRRFLRISPQMDPKRTHTYVPESELTQRWWALAKEVFYIFIFCTNFLYFIKSKE